MGVQWVLSVIAMVLGVASAIDYFRSGSWTPRAKIWSRMAFLFAALSIYLIWQSAATN